MITGREMYPSCSGRIREHKHWTLIKDKLPSDGYTGLIIIADDTPKDCWYTDIASFCDGEWYRLDYDPYLGVLRKMPVHENIIAYGNYIVPDTSEVSLS